MDEDRVGIPLAMQTLNDMAPRLAELGPDSVSPRMLGMVAMASLTEQYLRLLLEEEDCDARVLAAQEQFIAGAHALIGFEGVPLGRLDA